MRMRIVWLAWLAGFSLWSAGAADLIWQTGLPRALAQARAEHKLVFLNFTGSDDCVACQILATNTFARPEFAAFARSNLVLVEVDFPVKKPQTDALRAANLALADQFNVEGYPTLIALKPDGAEVWRNTGDAITGPADLIEKLKGIKNP